MTGFAIKVADKSLPAAFDLIADLLAHPDLTRMIWSGSKR